MFLIDKILNLFRYHGEIPMSIKLRASTLATITKCYIAFDRDGTCHIFPAPPRLLKNSGVWIPRGRLGSFQMEEVRFTLVKYQYSNWDTLFSPVQGYTIPFTTDRLKLTRKLKRKQKLI